MIIRKLMVLSLIGLLVAGCGTFSISVNPVDTIQATATGEARQPKPSNDTTETPAAPTETIEPTPEEEAVLPAPLYYLNPEDNQVWRVEQDGVTLTQISIEAAPIEQYDVNPVDGSLVMLSANTLIMTDALGGNRRVIVDAPSQEEAGVHWYLFARVSNPVWSDDGRQIAYGLNGVNIYEVETENSRVVLPNDEFPAEGEEVRRPINVYTPYSFAPDGSALLVMNGWYQSGGGWPVVLRLNTDGSLIELQGEGVPCCTYRWSKDSAAIYSAHDSFGMFEPGLWRSDAFTGETQTIIPSETADADVRVFNWPHDLGNGEIAVFFGEGPRSAYEMGQPTLLTIVRVEVQSGTYTGGISDYWVPGEAAWLADGSGVALIDTRSQPGDGTGAWPRSGTPYYLLMDGSEALELPAIGHTIHWGATGF